MKKLELLIILFLTSQVAFGQIDFGKIKTAVIGNDLSTEEVAKGLKEALEKGVSKGSDLVSQLDGYYKNPDIKIPFPPEVQKVEERLRQIGLGSEVDKFVLSLNRAAEDAAKEAKPIFVAAIKEMTIQDA